MLLTTPRKACSIQKYQPDKGRTAAINGRRFFKGRMS